jgi:hypothetical protein
MMILMLMVATAVPAHTAEAPLVEAGLEEEVRALNDTLVELVELLRRQLESSNAAVLMQRVQLMTNRIAPIEEELHTARKEARGLEDEAESMKLAADEHEAHLERSVATGETTDEQARQELELQLAMFTSRQKQVGDRLWRAQQRVIDLEFFNDTATTEIYTWEGEIDRVLGLR